jgi:hypothetical protein
MRTDQVNNCQFISVSDADSQEKVSCRKALELRIINSRIRIPLCRPPSFPPSFGP